MKHIARTKKKLKKNSNWKREREKKSSLSSILYEKSSSDAVLCTIHVLCLWATDNRYNLNTMFMLWNELNMGSSNKMANTNLKKKWFVVYADFAFIFMWFFFSKKKSSSAHFKLLLRKKICRNGLSLKCLNYLPQCWTHTTTLTNDIRNSIYSIKGFWAQFESGIFIKLWLKCVSPTTAPDPFDEEEWMKKKEKTALSSHSTFFCQLFLNGLPFTALIA